MRSLTRNLRLKLPCSIISARLDCQHHVRPFAGISNQDKEKQSLQIASDLHLEMTNRKFEDLIRPTAPYLALLGDIGVVGCDKPQHYPRYRDFMSYCSQQFRGVFIIPGNHEYYSNIDIEMDHIRVEDRIRSICERFPNLLLLQNKAIHFGRRKIIGSTLWSHVPSYASPTVEDAIGDYRRIYNQQPLTLTRCESKGITARNWNFITPADTNTWHRSAVKFIETELAASSEIGE